MPATDPTLEAAANVRAMWTYVYRNHSCLKDEEKGIACGPCLDIDNLMLACEELGRVKALRALGAGTPEAQQALRELVKAASAVGAAMRRDPTTNHVHGYPYISDLHGGLRQAAYDLAALATPTEEGR